MTVKIYFASNQLGEITDEQLQLMLDRFDLGKLVSAEKTAHGVMGQTMFITSSAGEYVLKGNPIFQGQFREEKFFVEHLATRTNAAVPAPYLIDDSDDIFGWSYSLMPRLSGIHLNAPQLQASLHAEDNKEIAQLLAATLVELHSWKVEQYGEFNPDNHMVRPFEGSYKTWLYNTVRYWLDDAKKYSVITGEDMEWVEDVLASSAAAFDELPAPCFVMGDYKPENFLLQQHADRWQVSGVFDFTNSYFGDGAADLPRMTEWYVENGEKELARQFLSHYLAGTDTKESFMERFRVHMLHRRILVWGCAKATNQATWDNDLSFSRWAEGFMESAASLLKDGS
ncbi:phosphotransferase family protein [Paenibacillus apiarius]|uniref:phosphotransferase family protein n=1 Tax=Paenibacillus apiarius TaxID=46240 RepID=UPI00197E95E8|nr:aminoglycoside phosphotransferase family protein [Paenibacillus apiarius]MBN3523610.1 aminoglycoside phosphotransferase family protein [Paenibacillus apiarius]